MDDTGAHELDGLLDRWVAAWALSRGATMQQLGRAWLVHVEATSRRVEYFIADPSAGELDALADLAGGAQDAWVTLLGSQPAPLPPHLDPLTHAERMMRVDLSAPSAPEVIAGVDLETIDGVTHATVTIDGALAARGQVAVVRSDAGSDAVFDRISTEEGFRRRGLASRVMAALTAHARAEGATTGLLMASVDGRPLYSSLGWSEVAPLQTFRGC